MDFWRTLEVSQFLLNVIMQGYKIPFFQLPTPFAKRNNTSARENSDFVSQTVNNLLRLDLIGELACKQPAFSFYPWFGKAKAHFGSSTCQPVYIQAEV